MISIRSLIRGRQAVRSTVQFNFNATFHRVAAYSSSRRAASKEEDEKSSMMSTFEKYKPRVINSLPYMAGAVVLYGVSKLFFDVSYIFLSLTPAVSLRYGFFGGLVSGGAVGALLYATDSAAHPRPEFAYRRALNLINQNENLRSLVGGKLVSGELKAYVARGGNFGILNGKPIWNAPVVELLFKVKAPAGDAIVCVIFTRHLSMSEVNFLAIDVAAGAHLKPIRQILIGAENNEYVRVFDRMRRDVVFSNVFVQDQERLVENE